MSDTNEPTKTKKSAKKVSMAVCVLLIIIALAAGGWAGYAYGKNTTKDDATKALNQKVSSLESDLTKAKAAVGSEVQEGQQSAESLQAENTALKQTVSDQQKKITDLEKQLEAAKNSTTAP